MSNDSDNDRDDMFELGDKLHEACDGYSNKVIFRALCVAMTYWMSHYGEEERKFVARALKRSIPEMLATANKAAAGRPEHTHH